MSEMNDAEVMLLAGAGEQELLRLWVARETQRGILFHDFMNGDADFVLIGAGFRLDGKRDGRLRELRVRIENSGGFVAEGFAGSGFFQLGDGANVTGVEFADLGELFALHDLDVLKTLGKIAVVVEQGRIVFQNAAFHFEIVDAAGERIGEGLEDEE